MANTTLVITVSTPRPTADTTARLVKDTTSPRNEATALAKYFEAIAAGLEPAGTSFDVQQSSNAPVRASGTIVLTYASIANNDTVTVAGTVLTCVTGTPSGAQFKKVTDGPTTAANLAALINANTTTNKLVSATSSSSTVTVTALAPGVIGNKLTTATSNSSGFTLSATLSSGAGGHETTATNYSRG